MKIRTILAAAAFAAGLAAAPTTARLPVECDYAGIKLYNFIYGVELYACVDGHGNFWLIDYPFSPMHHLLGLENPY